MSLVNHTDNNLEAALAVDEAGNVNFYYSHSNTSFYRRSIDRGTTWEPIIQLQIPAGYGDITLDDEGNIYLITIRNGIHFTHSFQ